MNKCWLVRFEKSVACHGAAEIRIEGSPISYSTVVGRLYKRHLTDAEFDRLFEAVKSALERMNDVDDNTN